MKLIAQTVNIYPGDGKDPYARTGQLSFYHLKQAGASGVLLGHSELDETPSQVNQKLKAAAVMKMPDNIVLLGEQWEDLQKPWQELDEQGQQKVISVVKKELNEIIQDITPAIVSQVVFSYEPGWGVRGSGKADVVPPQPVQIQTMAKAMRETLKEKYGEDIAQNLRIIYGGSMSPERAGEIAPLDDVDGFILGSAGKTTDWAKKIAQALTEEKKPRKPVLALNWKAYELQEPYQAFIDILRQYEPDLDIYLAPSATDLALIKPMLYHTSL